MMKIGTILAAAAVAVLMSAPSSGADEKTDERVKKDLETTIRHLLEFVRTSDVIFIRNGKEHSPEDAAEHIEKKYKHYRKKIETPEDFIERSATKSILSGKLYRVRLADGTVIPTRDWLTAELERYRTGMSRARPDTSMKGRGCGTDSLSRTAPASR
jgi:hypothetical protein